VCHRFKEKVERKKEKGKSGDLGFLFEFINIRFCPSSHQATLLQKAKSIFR